MNKEIPLTGGRVTQGVVRVGSTVRRPAKPNSAFVRGILHHLHAKAPGLAPEYIGQDPSGREIFSYLPGFVPADLGFFSDDQCAEAARIIRRLHDGLSSYPGLPDGTTVCHGDLSPCNFVFRPDLSGIPCGVIDWDAAHIGHAHDDLAYALWMWLDIGNDEQGAAYVRRRISLMLSAYNAAPDATSPYWQETTAKTAIPSRNADPDTISPDRQETTAKTAIPSRNADRNASFPPSAGSAAPSASVSSSADCADPNASFSPSADCAENHAAMKIRILREMHRVADSVFPTPEQTGSTREWALSCAAWAETYL